jgi:5-methylthioadenosine/S-adenosylhomocysteine deaminase
MSYLIRNATILTMDGPAGIEPLIGDILIESATISALGPGLEAPEGVEVLDGTGKLVMPGLVNAHMHSNETFFRGRYQHLPLEVWMLYAYPLVGGSQIPLRLLYLRTLLTAMESLKAGVTTMVDDLFDPPHSDLERLGTAFRAYEDAGIRANVSAVVMDKHVLDTMPYLRELLPDDMQAMVEGPAFTVDEHLAFCRSVFDTLHGKAGRLGFMLSASAPQRCSTELMQGLSALATERGVPYHTHILETKTQAVTGNEFYGKTLIGYMNDLGLLTPNTTIAHSIWVTDDDMALMGAADVSIAHNAVSNLKLGAGIAPIRRLLDAGVHVGLGTDGLCSNDSARIFDVMRFAGLLHCVATPDYDRWVGAGEVLRSATIEGARTAMLDKVTGSLAVGKRADLLLLDLGGYAYRPVNDVRNHLVYCENGSSIEAVMVDGRIVVDHGRLLTIDEAAIFAEIAELMPAYLAEHARVEALNEPFAAYFRQMHQRATAQDIGINRYSGDLPMWPGQNWNSAS